MSVEENRLFWKQIDEQAQQIEEKCAESRRNHKSGECMEPCCRFWLITYWKNNYKNFKISENGIVTFGDEKKYK